MRLVVDAEKCCGSGMCTLRAPQLFTQRDRDGRVVLLDEAPPPALQDAAREAAIACPVGAIRLVAGEET